MLNSVPESMRACLIEAAKLAGPAFKRKAVECGAAPGSSGPLSFSITVDASGRGAAAAPPPAAGPAMAAFAVAAAGIPAAPPGLIGVAESDTMISTLPGGNIGSNPLLGPLPSLAGLPSAQAPPLPVAKAAATQQDGSDDQQQLLELIRCALGCSGRPVLPAAGLCDNCHASRPPTPNPLLCSRIDSGAVQQGTKSALKAAVLGGPAAAGAASDAAETSRPTARAAAPAGQLPIPLPLALPVTMPQLAAASPAPGVAVGAPPFRLPSLGSLPVPSPSELKVGCLLRCTAVLLKGCLALTISTIPTQGFFGSGETPLSTHSLNAIFDELGRWGQGAVVWSAWPQPSLLAPCPA